MDLGNEKELVSRARKDPAAFAELYDYYYPKIFGYALRRTADIEAARDITSETFSCALAKLWQFRWRSISFSSWLYKIAGNQVNGYFRAAHYRKSVSLEELQAGGYDPPASGDPEGELIEAQERLERHREYLEIQQKIARLPTRYQEVIALRFFEQKQLKEIALILGKKEGTVKSLLHRAIERLRQPE